MNLFLDGGKKQFFRIIKYFLFFISELENDEKKKKIRRSLSFSISFIEVKRKFGVEVIKDKKSSLDFDLDSKKKKILSFVFKKKFSSLLSELEFDKKIKILLLLRKSLFLFVVIKFSRKLFFFFLLSSLSDLELMIVRIEDGKNKFSFFSGNIE